MMLHGILLLDKPSGMTSHDCVARTRHLLRQKEIGHLGTLDPRAKGLLPLCLGHVTKLSNFLRTDEKSYHFHIRLGIATNTQDMDGEIISEREVPSCTNEQLEQIAQTFVKQPYYQKTPDYSARKINGRKLYEYARTGAEVPQIPARLVTLHRLELKLVNPSTIEGYVSCTSGTYVRQLAVDIAEQLGTAGVLFNLTRSTVGPWDVKDAIGFEVLESELVLNPFLVKVPYFISDFGAMTDFPRLNLSPGLWKRIRNGVQPIHISLGDLEMASGPKTLAAVSQGDMICGVVREGNEAVLGALLKVDFVKDQLVNCRLQKVLAS